MNRVAAFDVGSTNFRFVVGTVEGEFLTEVREQSTDSTRLGAQIVEAIRTLQNEIDGEIDVVSIGTTGEVDKAEGVVHFDANDDEQTTPIHLTERMASEFDVPVHIENDANVAALGEYRFGAGSETRCVVHLTFGSGIGGGVVTDGTLLRGENGGAAELGLIPIRADNTTRSYGVRGAWEAYCSGRGIPRFVEELLEREGRDTRLSERTPLDARDVFEAAAEGDAVAQTYLDRVGRYNAAGIGAVVNTFDPGVVTLSGSVAANNTERVLAPIRAYLDEYTLTDPPPVLLSEIHEHIGLYGAIALAAREAESAHTEVTVE